MASEAHQHHGNLTNFWCFWQCGQVPNPAGRFRRLRAKAANSIAVKEDRFNLSIFGGRLFCHGAAHGAPGMRRRGLEQTGFLMLHKRRRHRNTGKDIDTGLDVDINNNRPETWGRTDYI